MFEQDNLMSEIDEELCRVQLQKDILKSLFKLFNFVAPVIVMRIAYKDFDFNQAQFKLHLVLSVLVTVVHMFTLVHQLMNLSTSIKEKAANYIGKMVAFNCKVRDDLNGPIVSLETCKNLSVDILIEFIVQITRHNTQVAKIVLRASNSELTLTGSSEEWRKKLRAVKYGRTLNASMKQAKQQMHGSRNLLDRWLVARANIRQQFVDIDSSELHEIVLENCQTEKNILSHLADAFGCDVHTKVDERGA